MVSDIPPAPDTVDALADALRADHVIVARAVGSGAAQSSYDRIGTLVGQLPFPAYVALVTAPGDVSSGLDAGRDLARAVARRIGEPGLYVVDTGNSVAEALITVPGIDDTLFSLTLSSNEDAIEAATSQPGMLEPGVWAEAAVATALAPIPEPENGTYPTNLDPVTITELAARNDALALPARPSTTSDVKAEPWTRGGRIALFAALLSGIGLMVRQCVAGWPLWRGRAVATKPVSRPVSGAGPEPAPRPTEIRRQATDELARLATVLGEVAAQRVRGDARIDADLVDAATLAQDAATRLLDAQPAVGAADLVGALVLARTGRRDARRAIGEASDPYRACFFNPLHSAGTREASWRLGEATVSVPVCPACERRLRTGGRPDALSVRRGRRERPYYEGSDVWARTGYGTLVDDLAVRVLTERGRR